MPCNHTVKIKLVLLIKKNQEKIKNQTASYWMGGSYQSPPVEMTDNLTGNPHPITIIYPINMSINNISLISSPLNYH